jgi:hypothetical protein
MAMLQSVAKTFGYSTVRLPLACAGHSSASSEVIIDHQDLILGVGEGRGPSES